MTAITRLTNNSSSPPDNHADILEDSLIPVSDRQKSSFVVAVTARFVVEDVRHSDSIVRRSHCPSRLRDPRLRNSVVHDPFASKQKAARIVPTLAPFRLCA